MTGGHDPQVAGKDASALRASVHVPLDERRRADSHREEVRAPWRCMNAFASRNNYLGPLILAQTNVPVRLNLV